MKVFCSGIAALAFIALAAVPAMAEGDDGLYDALPPPDSAFIRILNAGPGSSGFEMTVGTNSVVVGAQTVTPYVNLKAGPVTLSSPGASEQVNISAGKYYTYAVGSGIGKPALFSDDSLQDPAKGRLYFYNLTALGDVDLYVPAAKTEALKDVAAGGGRSVEIRAPLEVKIIARTNSGDIVSFDMVKVKRRGGTTLVLSGAEGNYAGFSAANSVAKN